MMHLIATGYRQGVEEGVCDVWVGRRNVGVCGDAWKSFVVLESVW